MRRVVALTVVAITLLVGGYLAQAASFQDTREATTDVDRVPATPVAVLPMWDAEFGFVIEELASGEPGAAPGTALRLFRVTVAPGGAIPDQFHPGPAVLYVESGTIEVTTLADSLSYQEGCGGPCPQGTPQPATTLGIEHSVELGPGASVFVDEDAGYYAIASDHAPAVVIVSGTFDTSQEVFQLPIIAEACGGGCS